MICLQLRISVDGGEGFMMLVCSNDAVAFGRTGVGSSRLEVRLWQR